MYIRPTCFSDITFDFIAGYINSARITFPAITSRPLNKAFRIFFHFTNMSRISRSSFNEPWRYTVTINSYTDTLFSRPYPIKPRAIMTRISESKLRYKCNFLPNYSFPPHFYSFVYITADCFTVSDRLEDVPKIGHK